LGLLEDDRVISNAIEKAVAYLDRVSFESLPILPAGSCVLASVSVHVLVLVKIPELPPESIPNCRTMSVTAQWLKPLSPVLDHDVPDDDPEAQNFQSWDELPPF
jgi:uncharacterized protein